MGRNILEWKKVYLQDLEYVVRELKELVEKPALIILSGEMGAGKTTFVRSFLGESSNVVSPTYSVINEIGDVAHGDFYRIEKAEEITHLELPLYAEGKNFVLIEWGKRFFPAISRELGSDFGFYELKIKINEAVDGEISSRNFLIEELD